MKTWACFARFTAAAALAILPLILLGCTGTSTSAHDTAPSPISSRDPNVFEVDHPEQFPLCAVETRAAAESLDANGVLSPDINLTVHVTSLSGGRVLEVRGKLGDDVQKGQVLVVIRSQDLASAISDYQKSKADEFLASKALDRAHDLYSHGAMAQKDLQQAEDEEQKAKVDLETSAERIRMLGGDVDHLSPIIEVKSPISGTIVDQNVAAGEGVKSLDNSPNLFTVADLSRVWLLCDVYENNLEQVTLGDEAVVKLNAFPNRTMKGRISNISKILDPSTRTAKVRVELDNKDGLLRPGMFAVATFKSQETSARLVVPQTALLRLHDKDWVFRSEGPNKYRRIEVQAGTPCDAGLQFVLAGLRPGEQIVANVLQFASAIEQK
jgi:cobalt-zinc-cadmium efflux system membrane fusion protein